jgi:ERCC4-type nuclease
LSGSLTIAASKALLEYFGSLYDVVIQDEDFLVQVKGVGRVTAHEIYTNARKQRKQVG